jgi:MraZ protein
MLLGTYPAKFVSGHRIAIPSQFRKNLGKSFILARWYERCLVLIDETGWSALYKRLVGADRLIVAPVRDTERFILSQAFEVYPDEQGRIVIPEVLIKYSEFEEDIYFIGVGDRAEVWSKKNWEAKEKEVTENAAQYIEELAKKK